MSFAARLIHTVAVVSPGSGDPEDEDDLDAYGHAIPGADHVVVIAALIQPRTTEEVAAVSQAGPEISTHVIFAEPRVIPANAYIVDADEDGPLTGGRRFDVTGVRSFEFGRSPHLEIDARLVGRTEGPGLGS